MTVVLGLDGVIVNVMPFTAQWCFALSRAIGTIPAMGDVSIVFSHVHAYAVQKQEEKYSVEG